MAKLTGPLLSFGARGAIGKTMVTAKTRGIPYARQYVIPSNPQTVAQQATRTLFSQLREAYKLAPASITAAWDAFAQGRPFYGVNKFVGENIRVLLGEADFANMIFSPGAKGGIPPTSFAAVTGAGSGEINFTFVLPTPPTGWALHSVVVAGFPDQTPGGIFEGPFNQEVVLAPTLTGTIDGFDEDEVVAVGGWVVWTKPNGTLAYSVGTTDVVTAGAP
jgi:hypothetical protein